LLRNWSAVLLIGLIVSAVTDINAERRMLASLYILPVSLFDTQTNLPMAVRDAKNLSELWF